MIGDVRSARVWHDSWVPRKRNEGLLVQSSHATEDVCMVSELMNGRLWNPQVISATCITWEAEKIQSLVLSHFECLEAWAWRWSKHVEFSVKSAYYEASYAENRRGDKFIKGGEMWGVEEAMACKCAAKSSKLCVVSHE